MQGNFWTSEEDEKTYYECKPCKSNRLIRLIYEDGGRLS
jgi:hypothetical protein